MIRFLFRFIGLIGLALAFILIIIDGTTSIAGNRLILTSFQSLLDRINPTGLAKLKPLISSFANGIFWDPVAVSILGAPAWAVLGVIGILFMLLGRRKKPLIGYAR
jgi:hypothetical protein